ncbi:MAG: zf-HC2 domain-containing protein [Propionicimonas sp.]
MTEWHPEPDQLVALALTDLEPDESGLLVEHLATCPSCRDAYTEVSDGLAQALAAAPAIAPPPGFSGRVLAAMAPAATRVPSGRGRLLVAAAVLLGLLSGIGGTLAVSGGLARPGSSASSHAPVAIELVTGSGQAVGSAGITTQGGRTFLLLNITSGRPGASYECVLVAPNGQRTSGGKWGLTSTYGSERASGSWLVPLAGEPPVGVELVAPSGTVWSTGHF